MKKYKRYFENKFGKKGFTLIELLAIILVLAILALIVIPFITKIVEEASKEAFKQTTKGTATAIENKCDLDVISNEKIIDTYAIEKYIVTIGGKINVNARLPLYANANVDKKCNVQIAAHNKKWCATKAYDEDKITITKYVEGECIVGTTGPILTSGNDTWDGWINMTLYYPSNSTERQWRLGSQGEIRYDENLMWQYYTGSITVPLSRVEDVWIRYNLNGETVTIPPVGTLLVDIEPDSYGTSKKVDSVNVKITYDKDATVKEYRVGDSGWMPYTGEFTVTENVIIEARASKPDNVYDASGNLLVKRNAVGRDAVYIGNIGINETELAAPTIERFDATNEDEVAQVKITYPAEAIKKIYKENYGIEENYTNQISVEKYGTYIIAYYYDASGNRSKAAAIYINNPNDTGGTGTPNPPTPYPPNPPLNPTDPYPPEVPSYRIVAPTITGNPSTSTTGSVTVTVNAPTTADKIYIKQGNNKYQQYTSPISVTDNTLITAYYVTYDGEVSEKGYYRVTNIVKGTKPSITINADPYPYPTSYGQKSVNISLVYSNANTVEYSEDGIVYSTYTGAFTVTKNETIYARATNINGVTTTQLSLTNIGGYINPPKAPKILSVAIYATPEPSLSKTITDKVKIKIDYDKSATQKYYTIGYGTTLIPYVGEFDVTGNTTIYAYALSSDGAGSDSKVIDNLSSGIATPIIVGNPDNSSVTSKTSISITYDKNATIKRYSVNNGSLRDYTKSFDVSSNDIIYAYSKNALGQVAEATYQVSNIVPEPSMFLIDKGYYFVLKLNYPSLSKTREYKWTANGTWKAYDEKGILLIKPEYKDKLLDADNNFKVGIEDDSGNVVDFTNHWYIIELSFTQIEEFIFMRWDRTSLPKPEIVLDTLEPAKEVNATIIYDKGIVKKQYKIVNATGDIVQDWTIYSSPVKITTNNTIVYARGQDDAEVWTDESLYKVTNIDENQPVIKLTTDLVTATQKLGIKVVVTDDVLVSKVKWAKGILGESYFTSGGTEILNNSIVSITENAYYTFYAEDGVGNKQVYTINVENIDLTPPIIMISSTPENTVGTSSQVTIDYGDSTTKQYKIGSSTTWVTYSAAFNVTSYTVLTNNWQNSDGTVTIFAKGKDSVGNEVIITKKIVNLDLDMPNKPTVVSNVGYPVLTSYGVSFDATATINYDSRNDIDNYYSIDNGATWILYTGSFNLSTGTIQAKSVKRTTGLTATTTKTIATSGDSIGYAGYDGNATTYYDNSTKATMKVDPSVQGKKLKVNLIYYGGEYSTGYMIFKDTNGTVISQIPTGIHYSAAYNSTVTIPTGTAEINFSSGTIRTYEISLANEPTYTAVNGYTSLNADLTKAIKTPYQMVGITYFSTSEQRLYRIGTTGDWLEYNDQSVKVNQGQTIYSKGIDKNGIATTISSYTVNMTDAVGSLAFDGNDSTYTDSPVKGIVKVDPSMQGKSISVNLIYYGGEYSSGYMIFKDTNGNVISQITTGVHYSATYNGTVTIPNGTTEINFTCGTTLRVYEIKVLNEPVIVATNGYTLLHADPTKAIKIPYQILTINYFPTSVQKLYRIGTTGDWLNYTQAVRVEQGQTIYAKGIDQYGNETRIITSKTVNVTDAVGSLAYDGNDTTYSNNSTKAVLKVDPSIQGKTVKLHIYYGGAEYSTGYIKFLNASGTLISQVTTSCHYSGVFNGTVIIPAGTVEINILQTTIYVYEIQVLN